MKRTPWFDGSVKPTCPGVYECDWLDPPFRSHWFNFFDGKQWYWGGANPRCADQTTPMVPGNSLPLVRWRGVVAPTKDRA